MTKVILVGDVHLSDRPPSSCTDSYTDDLFAMLRYIRDEELSVNADAVVFAGDIFHHKQPARTSHALVLRTIDALQEFRNPLIVVGNHDISNDRLDSLSKQPLGVVLEAGIPQLDGWHPTLPLFGVPWQQRWLHEDTPMEAFAAWREGDGLGGRDLWSSLAVTHAPIYPPATRDAQMFDLVPTAGAHGLSEAMNGQGYLYYGHIHEDHGVWEDGGVTYANVGALSRGSLTEYNRERQVQVCVWDNSAGGASGFTPIVIPHKPADEVFRIEEVTQERSEKRSLDDFLSSVGSSTLAISSTESVVSHIRSREDVSETVRSTAIEILEEVG